MADIMPRDPANYRTFQDSRRRALGSSSTRPQLLPGLLSPGSGLLS